MLKDVRKKRAYEDIVRQIRTLIEKGKAEAGGSAPHREGAVGNLQGFPGHGAGGHLSLETMKLVRGARGTGPT